jgi:type IV pilus assembly protein PilP
MNIFRTTASAVALGVLSILSGCGDGGIQEVKQWMEEVRRQTPVSVQRIQEPKKFIPFVYSGKNIADPYSPAKLSAALAKLQANSSSSLKPNFERRKEPLENFPLDTIKMVGTLEKPGLIYGLLQADKAVFQVKAGNYLGQNFGMITKITETEVELKEIVRDAAGDWVERKAKLELQESKK